MRPDPDPPFLFVDAYPFDYDDPRTRLVDDPPWGRILAERMIRGVILKATEGTRYAYTPWFTHNFGALVAQLGESRGRSVLLGGYHYAQFSSPPADQADAYCAALEGVGYCAADVVPVVDVEDGGERSTNRRTGTSQVVDCVSSIVERIKARTGRRVMLYGRGLMRDRGITSRMGCDLVWNPSYTRTIEMNGLSRVDGRPGPWSIDDVALWQYEGDGAADVTVTHLQTSIAGISKVDLSVFVDGARAPTWARCVQRLT